MSKSQSIGAVAVIVAILLFVGVPVLKNAFSSPGIPVREAPSPAKEPPKSENTPAVVPPVTAPAQTSTEAKADPTASNPAESGAENAPGASALASGKDAEKHAAPAPKPEVVVQVAGAVKHPGVYHLAMGARNDDAVKAAGGLTASANAASVNLAAHAEDGAQLYVKNLKEQPTGGISEDTITPAPTTVKPGKTAAKAPKHGSAPVLASRGSASKPAKLKDPSEGKININTASLEELQRIPHVGPAMAEKVIAYRQENHGFQSLEDLMQIRGVGAKTYEKMVPFIKLH